MEPQIRFLEKSVIIHRDENGFGLRVGGQNPVFVDHVHENGAAWKAGVRKEDRIIKVNGTLVRSFDHQQVVRMIQNCSPFVNLTLHSPEAVVVENHSINVIPLASGMQSTLEQISNTTGFQAPNLNPTNNNSTEHNHALYQRLHHSVPTNVNWLLNIADDLFQDSQHQHQNLDSSTVSSTSHQSSGVSKLVVSGPSPLVHSNSSLSIKSKLRHNRCQSSTRDNPYYYYKTAPEKSSDPTSSCNNVLGQEQNPSSRPSTSLSIVRSRSSSKMSLRSTSSKYKTRNLRSRLVEDLRSLAITNSQTTPSSLSTSPSSSDLSDCDDTDASRVIECLSVNTSTSSINNQSNLSILQGNSAKASGLTINQIKIVGNSVPRTKQTTRRLEIIKELVETEKAHTERLKQLNDLLYKPIKAEGLVPVEQLKMIFSCHKTLFKIHRQIYKILSAAQLNVSETHQEPLVGKALIEIFEGELSKRLEKAASTFCACQSTNSELLNRITRKDTKAGEFLAQVANQQMIGRLGIKDLLASCFQRLTKYPLLLENLLKATPIGSSRGIHSKSLSEGSIITNMAATSAPICHHLTTTVTTTTTNTNSTTLATDSCTSSSEHHQHQSSTPADQASASNLITAIPEASSTPDSNKCTELDKKHGATNDTTSETTTTSTSATVGPDIITSTEATENENEQLGSTLDEDYAYERLCISRALHQSRHILIHVNDAVTQAVSHNKLREIWKKTDKNPNLPVIDIETQQMLYEGPLTLRLARRTFEVYVLLLTHYLVILTREGQDKYKLKYFTAEGKQSTQLSPIFNIDEHLATRDTATDENGFYLLCKRKDDSRIYEFASQSPTERAKWKEKIHMAQLYNFATVPDDNNTLTRYRELITLATSNNTPNNIEHHHQQQVSTTANNSISNTAITTTTKSSPAEGVGVDDDV